MNALHPNLRSRLEKTVLAARQSAEKGAREALERLAVGAGEPFVEMSPVARALRNRLRARGRQLGDTLDPRAGKQTLEHLTAELAYEYWHRMLFTRFLAENHLLMHPDGIAVSLDECQELAPEEGAPDGWTLAAWYAARMLPQIFRPDDPVLQVALAPEHRYELEKLLSALPSDVFTADDSLGWVYQFWQAERKEQVNRSGNKIGADELPAVTQLFTEHYMVLFLLHNSLGAWWVANHPGVEPPVRFEYLRTLEDGTSAAGSYPGWPRTAQELKLLDPCCGSSHCLVSAFEVLTRLRMYEEGLSARQATEAVLRDNLFGLELDPRCTQIAAFALALAAWKFPGAGGYRPLPPLNIACSGIAPRGRKEDWLALAGNEARLQVGMEKLYDLFQQAPELGSLIEPRAEDGVDLFTAGFAELQPLLEKALQSDRASMNADFAAAGVAAQGIAHAAELLTGHYHLVMTNVPYLARGKQGKVLRDFCAQYHADAKTNLAAVFVERCLSLCAPGGSAALVTPQNWLFLKSYKNLRQHLLREQTWNMVARLGPGAFETISGEVVNVTLLLLTQRAPCKDQKIHGIEASTPRTAAAKAAELMTVAAKSFKQARQLGNPDARMALEESDDSYLLNKYANGLVGIQTGDDPMFITGFWELGEIDKCIWEFLQATPDSFREFDGQSWLVKWEQSNGLLLSSPTARPTQGLKAVGKPGIAIHRMRQLFAYRYGAERFHQNVAVIVPHNPDHLPAIWCFCSSPEYNEAVRQVDQSLKVTNATLVKVPFDLDYWTSVAQEQYPNGLPKPYSDDPTQWIFHGHPAQSEAPLHVAVARLLGYRWPAEQDSTMELSDDAHAWVLRSQALLTHADGDGIVCIPAVRGEKPAADRLRELLAAAYGQDWSPVTQDELLAAIGFGGKTLENWLRDGFFEQHCKLFHQRPFIWHVWDGRRDGFSALVNYHTLDRRQLEKLTYTYLGDWIKRQEDSRARGESGAEARLLAAHELQHKLKRILEGQPPYDIFVRWKPLERQPIGWEPDLNDGVRLNIRPLVHADVLRKRPGITWSKDRGKNPPGSPWGEERLNDRHITLEEKRAVQQHVR